jgi:hypothetical protein
VVSQASGSRRTGRRFIAELRATYWDEAQGALVIPFTGGRTFTFGSKLLRHTGDATMVLSGITFWHPHEGPPPEICSCEKLSFRHAVEYHGDAAIDVVRQPG